MSTVRVTNSTIVHYRTNLQSKQHVLVAVANSETNMQKEYTQIVADDRLRAALDNLVRISFAEDLEGAIDWTTWATIPESSSGACEIRTRVDGVAAGLVTVPWILESTSRHLNFEPYVSDGAKFSAGDSLGRISGDVRELLTVERVVLNIVSRLCGVATLTARYVEEIAGTSSRLYDTRKTTAGWRRLEKYAVVCGGGTNHRTGLFDGFLIKDNHLALGGCEGEKLSGAEAVRRAKQWSNRSFEGRAAPQIIEIEIDSLTQLQDVLHAEPDIVLLDNFSLEDLAAAVALRNRINPNIQLEASGGVTLGTIRKIALTGVDRISCGAITHQATWLDLGLDWMG